MVSYSESAFDPSKVDQKSAQIYGEICSIYDLKHLDFYDTEDQFYQLLHKHDEHYLIYYFLGNFYKSCNKYQNAVNCYKICTSKKDFIDAYLNLAIIYQIHNDFQTMKKYLMDAANINKDDIRIINFLGVSYYVEKDYYRAYEYYKKVISTMSIPNESSKMVFNNIGFTCTAIGKGDEAIVYFDKGLQIPSVTSDKKMDIQLLQNKLLCLDYLYTIPEDTFRDYLMLNDLYGVTQSKYICQKSTNSKLKIGYVSPDFRKHVVSFFMDPIIRLQNRDSFEIYCYSNFPQEDEQTQRFKSYKPINWFSICNMSDDDAADLIYSHKIDILVDLAGQTNNNRLGIFARKPAYMQITYLGFPNSSGLKTMDYRITDHIADPPNTKQKYTEMLIRMPKCFICFESNIKLSSIPIIPKPINSNDPIVFAVINKIQKHNNTTFAVWNSILSKVPNSIILIKKDIKSSVNIDDLYMQKFTISKDRIKMMEHIESYDGHLLKHNDIDICLDTFPYSGTTTTCCSLMMSTPIITLHIPNRHVSNVSESILTNMGFSELVAKSTEDYIQKAVNLANNRQQIIEYKKIIRSKFFELMNVNTFIKDFDNLIYDTYKKHQ